MSKKKSNDPFRELIKARKAKGLSVDDVALALHLTPRAVEEIEKGNWEYFPKGPYFKGNVKRVCDFLDVPSAPLVEVYQTQYCEAQVCDYQEPQMHRIKLSSSYQHKKYRTAYGLACAFMVVMLVGIVTTQNILSSKTVADTSPLEPVWAAKNSVKLSLDAASPEN
ncbi:MAG: helix-turn-helix domain-containing protein [Cellvibrionales bacterium]|nr:helix-turn-helix domain-containing protein [Cellvibrionales bacterium]